MKTRVVAEKPWWQSKTIWANVITLVVSVLTMLAANDLIKQYPDVAVIITGVAIPILNTILRLITAQPITEVLRRRRRV